MFCEARNLTCEDNEGLAMAEKVTKNCGQPASDGQ